MGPDHRKEKGDTGEKAATVYLKGHGYQILEKNFMITEGEIDIISRKDPTGLFMEVKTKTIRRPRKYLERFQAANIR
jgi:putative endonuclease